MMNRGDHLEPIFKDDTDRELFTKTLRETCESSGWVVHSFVYMANHYHLLIETSRPTLVKGMQYLNSTYTQRYNVRHKTRGHLFQGRYKALLVDSEAKGYFLTVSDYIHLNPVRSKKVQGLAELLKDKWSSVGWLSGFRKDRPEWLRWERVYGELGLENWRSRSRREYREYLERRIEEISGKVENWKNIRRGWCFGSDYFLAKMKEKLEEMAEEPRGQESWAGEAVEEMEQDLATRILKEGAKRLGYSGLKSVQGLDRFILAKHVRSRTNVSVEWVAQQFRLRTRAGMSSSISRITRLIQTDRSLEKRFKLLV